MAPPALTFDERLWASLRPTTQQAYRLALRAFRTWAAEQDVVEPVSLYELDATLVAYFRSGIRLSQARTLAAAVEKTLPAAKRHLPHARALIVEGERWAPPQHTIPLSWVAAAGTAFLLATVHGVARIGGLLLLQSRTGLRPSEALQLERQHLVPSHLNRSNPAEAVLILGTRQGTKVGRAQFVTTADEVAKSLISAFHATTADGARLTAFNSYAQYARLLAKVWSQAGVDHLRFTAHSARSGWATELRLRGTPFPEIKSQGRWSSDKSLITYLDVATATMMELQLGALSNHGEWLLGDVIQRFPWWH